MRYGRDTELLRAELFSIEQLKRHAVTLGEQHTIDLDSGVDRLLPRLADNARVLLETYKNVAASATPGQRIQPTEAWLLDNFYLIEQQINLARRHLPRGYSRQLPRLAEGASTGFPRIYDLALELISHMDGRVDSDNVTQFIAAYQTVEPLELGELWAFPIMLQLALLENLRRVALRIAQRRKERDAAIIWADRMLAAVESDPKQLIQLLAEFAHADVPLTAPFVEEFYERLQAQGPPMAFVQTWVEQKLLEQGVTARKLSEAAGRTDAANQISIANSVSSLRFIGSMDWKVYVESLSVVEKTLCEDPSNTHARQDFATRDRYRHVIEDVARGSACNERDVAHEALVLAKAAAVHWGRRDRRAHVGYYLVDEGRPALERSIGCQSSFSTRVKRATWPFRLSLFLGSIFVLTLVITIGLLVAIGGLVPFQWQFWFYAITGVVGSSALAVSLVNRSITLFAAPRTLPRLDFSQGIPDDCSSMVIVPTLLSSRREVDLLLEALEIRYLGNRDANLYFALLTDFRDAAEQTLPDDAQLVAYARAQVEALNETYRDDRPCVFYLFHRPRQWNPIEQVWMGYERKRGKLEQFNARLRGEAHTAFSDIVGDQSLLGSIQYVITLDTDTLLPRDAARSLVGNLAHPLNRPVYDAAKGRIVEGYAILQPRTSISLTSANLSRFTKLFSGDSGLDPYTREVSDVYQDVFGEGSYIGKGIYDVDAFRQAVDGRFPDNLILSHDLLEGGYARSALVSDIELIEEQPATLAIEASRRHRWIRGDWQLAGWLLPRVPGPPGSNGAQSQRQANPLSALSRWKIFDNMRRSLVAPMLLALLVGGWLAGYGTFWVPALFILAVVFLPALLFSLIELPRKPGEYAWLAHLRLSAQVASRPIVQALLTLTFLPFDTRIALGAIWRSAVRMPFTRHGLLLWQLPGYARRNASSSLTDFYREMWVAPLLAVVVVVVLIMAGDLASLLLAAPILLLWCASPLVGWWISQPLVFRTPGLSREQHGFLRSSARRTWRFFADFVGPADNWLPPDNFQAHPAPVIASRTSPTNIGMSLLADLAAVDFGYLTVGECLQRIGNTVTSMEKLERYRGHLFNWYDTRTLQPLNPRYVSSVDSGNLAGSLLTLQAGLAELKAQPVLSLSALHGLQDTLQVLADQLPGSSVPELAESIRVLQVTLRSLLEEGPPMTLAVANSALDRIDREGKSLTACLPENADNYGEMIYWIRAFDQQRRALRDELDTLVPESWQGTGMPTRSELASALNTAAQEQLNQIDDLISRCDQLAEMDFEFLYDVGNSLLTIGYDVTERRRDPACYDLLASESRLASFLLIAQGQVSQKHWFALGRLLTGHGRDVSLISWSGSMFEYLMPQLIMPSFENTLLEQSCKAAVSRQIEYGRQRAVPWGISESCYNTTDLNHVYQYRAFGVPGLGLKRGLSEDLVIAPYASALALTVMPQDACRNLQAMADQGFLGDYGFYEAIDYTPTRVPRGKSHAIVQTFMAHHQGMSLLSFAHVLFGQPMQRRFMSDPLVRATELLLQERIPKKGDTLHPHAAEVSAAAQPPVADDGSIMRVFSDPDSRHPEVHLLSNGSYHVMATQAGGGTSRWRDLAVTRWREDATTDDWGTFIYLRDRDSGQYWSAAHQPTLCEADHYEAIFVQGRAEYRRRDHEIEAHTDISVSPEDDVEIRRVTLTNQSLRSRQIEVTSFAEVILAPLTADLAHRSFSNLFVQTEILPGKHAILCTRRPRTPGEQVPWMFHLLTAPGSVASEPSCETDRARFIGRGRTAANPVVFDGEDHKATLSNTEGAVLDPCVAISSTLTLRPDESASVQIISGVADTREAALALLEKYGDRHFVERAFEMAWFQSQEVLRHLNVTEADAQSFGRLASSVIYSNPMRRAEPDIIARNQLGQSGLWRFAISGDLPIVLLFIGEVSRIALVKQVVQAHAYWRMKGLAVDLVIVNEGYSGYRDELQDMIISLINAGPEAQVIDKPGGVFVRRAEELSEDERVLLQTVSRVVFSDTSETLMEHVDRRVSPERPTDLLEPSRQMTPEAVDPPLAPRELIFDNGLGGFTPDGHEYVITLEPGQTTPAPWANVIASPHIGTVVSESGSAYTWVENAHEFRLTPWHNDPLSDSSGEAMYIRDEDTGAFWSPTPLPAGGRTGYVCRHGFGYSVFEHNEAGITSVLTTYVAMDAPVKFLVIKLSNHSERRRSLSLTGYWELVLGEWRHSNMMHIATEVDLHSGALFARNPYGHECRNRVVFAQTSERDRSVSGNRTEFIGRNGTLNNPAAMRRKQLSGKTGAGLDPCAAIQTPIELDVGEEREIVFVIGAAQNADEARHLIQQYSGQVGARHALEMVWDHWNHTLGAVSVDTPDVALNIMANGWLIYQTLSCRLWARSGYYQSGGAYGFRDQLQDTMALIHATPWLAREQLIRHAGHQFLKGDVQHWWHPPGGQGVRTHFSDDYLWLPYATCRYVRATGDTGVLDESIHFLEGRELDVKEEAYYDQPQRSPEAASLYEHCVRAIRHGLRFGAHQLPLMGCGDWNDGMNLVGKDGRGESVWLAWFLVENLELFADLASDRNEQEFASLCRTESAKLRGNIEAQAWDGAWYRRAYFDDGTPLGSSSNDECQIDSISQSWSVISKGGDALRARQAMKSVDQRLVRRDKNIIQLLDPPFDTSGLEPGYIKGYIPGVRENGGQYTHAAIWTTMAFAMQGDTDRAWELFAMLNPVNHGDTPEGIELYKVEPYVMCADIYGVPPHIGRGGWTWYTGAAGWMYRLIVETLLGLQLEGDHLRISPCIPADWQGYKIHYRYRNTVYHITLSRVGESSGQTTPRVIVDGFECSDARIPLTDDNHEHYVEVELNT